MTSYADRCCIGAMWRNLPEEDKDSFKVMALLNIKPKVASPRTAKILKRKVYSNAIRQSEYRALLTANISKDNTGNHMF